MTCAYVLGGRGVVAPSDQDGTAGRSTPPAVNAGSGLTRHLEFRDYRAHLIACVRDGRAFVTPSGAAVSEQEWTPAFPGQRRPFQPGHELSMQHGAFSPRRVDPLAASFVALVEQDATVTWLAPVHRPALWAWARAEAQVQLLTEYLARAGEESADGVGDLEAERVRSAYLLLHRAETRATTQRARLGFDPLSRARLGRDIASAGAADAVADLTRMREQHERATGARVIDGD